MLPLQFGPYPSRWDREPHVSLTLSRITAQLSFVPIFSPVVPYTLSIPVAVSCISWTIAAYCIRLGVSSCSPFIGLLVAVGEENADRQSARCATSAYRLPPFLSTLWKTRSILSNLPCVSCVQRAPWISLSWLPAAVPRNTVAVQRLFPPSLPQLPQIPPQ